MNVQSSFPLGSNQPPPNKPFSRLIWFAPWVFLVILSFAQGACTCITSDPPLPREIVACVPQHETRATKLPTSRASETAAAGSLQGTFSVTPTGEASFVVPIPTPAGRAGIEPKIALAYNSAEGDGIAGQGFSLSGSSTITRCPKNIAQDGEIRAVRYDSQDKLCLDGQPLVQVAEETGQVEYRTLPDTFVKVVGYAPSAGIPQWFEVFAPNGVITEYGRTAATRPRGPNNSTRAWLAAKTHDGRGNALTYGYCFANTDEYTAEYALDEIRYTQFDGSPALEATRAVKFVYAQRKPEQARLSFFGGMAVQRSLQLNEIQMVGPGEELVTWVDLEYTKSEATGRTLLTKIEECAADGVCKPATLFSYSTHEKGFIDQSTELDSPTSRKASPMLVDMDGDGLDDVLVPDTHPALSTPANPITEWRLFHNGTLPGESVTFSDLTIPYVQDDVFVADPSGPADPTQLQPELGTVLDYNQDGRKDILLHDIYQQGATWKILIAKPAPQAGPNTPTFEMVDTGIARPFGIGAQPVPPALSTKNGSMHLADVDGNRVADLIQCTDHSDSLTGDPSKPEWKVHRWLPAQGGSSMGFDPEGEVIEALELYRCDVDLKTTDIDGDGKTNLLVVPLEVAGDGSEIQGANYEAFSRNENGTWEIREINLPIPAPGGRVVFLDVNGDGLPDAVESGFSNGGLYTLLNTGTGFAPSQLSLDGGGYGGQDALFRFATPIDANGDGRQDLLVPMFADGLGAGGEPPEWVFLIAQPGLQSTATFTIEPSGIPFEPLLGEAATLADPHGPRIGDLNGDGASDVAIWLSGKLHIFENQARDQDLVIGVHQGSNPHDPTDPEYVPDVAISYGHLTDPSITTNTDSGALSNQSALYFSRWDKANECTYPRRCTVGARRVVSGYRLSDGVDGERRYSLRYRDGRVFVAQGFLGFGARFLTDLDTGEITADFFDNQSFDATFQTYPFAKIRAAQWRVTPGWNGLPDPEKVELSFLNTTRLVVPTNDSKTYFTLTTENRLRRAQGEFDSAVQESSLLEYTKEVESGAANVPMLRDTTAKVTNFDDFGNVLSETSATVGVNLTTTIDRTFKNDVSTWLIGQLQTQKECSTANASTQCRAYTRTTTPYGEVATETAQDEADPATRMEVSYGRDQHGNVTSLTAKDPNGAERVASITYDSNGIYPREHTNPAGHKTTTEFDPRLGVVTRITDANELVTEHHTDGFGRLTLEKRPDGTSTSFTISRTRDGGPNKNAWRIREREIETGGQDEEIERDAFGRVVQRWWYGPTPEGQTNAPRITQRFEYDRLTGRVARRSIPIREDAAINKVEWETFLTDGLGREVKRTTAYGATTETEFDVLTIKTTDPLGNVSIAENDALGRKIAVTDAANGITVYTYGPFGRFVKVTGPDGAATLTTFDAMGRPAKTVDPDKGGTQQTYNAFGELVSSVDALGNETTFERDPLGRVTKRLDDLGATTEITTWTYDTAPNGKGKIHHVKSIDAEKTYTYDTLGRVESVTLEVTGSGPAMAGKMGYDLFGRVESLTYPTFKSSAPFAVVQEYDAHGFTRKVRDRNTDLTYWQLTGVDDAGRFAQEQMGNGVSTTHRTYFAAQQRLKSITTENAAGLVQSLEVEWDARLNLKSRTDDLQPQHTTERFRYDALERLTCSYFSAQEDVSAPCDWSYQYAPNGNLIYKSDVGALEYNDPTHPHGATAAGGAAYQYDATGNQTARPGGVTVVYTPFDLPRKITQPSGVISFGYDGDQKRVHKTTATHETLYFADLYERVKDAANAITERFYVHSPGRVIAIVTRGGNQPGTTYVHADHLGSVDVLTDADGKVTERRSYDAFGRRRNPEWGAPVPASFPDSISLGYTGHEDDGEVGLVNMKGRMFDPKLGRFLSTDPIVQNWTFSQAWNPYSYVFNNPLTYTDPGGFDGEPKREPSLPVGPNGFVEISVPGTRAGPPKEDKPKKEAEHGVGEPSTDVDTPGSEDPTAEPDEEAEDEPWYNHPVLQTMAGGFGGALLGIVPGAGVAEEAALAEGLVKRRSVYFERGKALGMIGGGLYTTAMSLGGEIFGGAATVTGVGAAVGVPAIAVSTVGVVGGAGNILAGISAWMSAPKGGDGQVHHVMTNKNRVSSSNGGPWTPRFEKMANKAGMTLDDAANQVRVPGHKGPHPQAYHQAVYDRLEAATDGLTGEEYSKAFKAELDAIRTELQTDGSTMQKLLVQP
ncbi:MAG: VCBS repeat-containing protein [Polyangiaceae bacterium]|nr:VCBS repeat-containing protein [Polyangiaceae bacterium]